MKLNVGLAIPVNRALTERIEYDQTTTEMITMTIVIIEGTGNLMARSERNITVTDMKSIHT